MRSIKIENFELSLQSKVFIIAELSANHNGSLEIAKETIRCAKKIGANAIKLQTYTADTITLDCKNDYFKIKHDTIWDGKYLHDLYKEAYTPWDWHPELFEVAAEEGIICFSSPFDLTAVDFLEDLNVPAYKIASFEITDIPLIEYAASKGKPMIISTGIADEEDIFLAIKTCKSVGNDQIIMLKTTSQYPAKIEDANLLTINGLAEKFGIVPGISDHTLGITVPVVATALGARVIEKHFIIDKSMGGPDASFSLDEEEFRTMVLAVREAQKSLGEVNFTLSEKAKVSREFSKSLFVVENIKKGETFANENIRSIRPGYGLHPKYYKEIIGKTATQDIDRGTPLNFDFIKF